MGVLFLDFKIAFDSISYVVCVTCAQKLSACVISGDFYNYIASYLKDRKKYTVVNNANSEDEHLDYGVPQGSILVQTSSASMLTTCLITLTATLIFLLTIQLVLS